MRKRAACAHVMDSGGLAMVPCSRNTAVQVVLGSGEADAGGDTTVVIVAVVSTTPYVVETHNELVALVRGW